MVPGTCCYNVSQLEVIGLKVLIIGNGFDLAHNLPTRYSDFLRICCDANATKITWNDNSIESIAFNRKKVNKNEIQGFAESLGEKKWNQFKGSARCYWIKHFQERQSVIGGNWLDFEEEIKKVLDFLVKEMAGDKDNIFNINACSNQILVEYCKRWHFDVIATTYRKLFEKLKLEEEKLVYSLDIYMHDYIEKRNIEPISYFERKKFDKILSFNYTNIYSSKYKKDIECCYIHGKSTGYNNTNIVLGFDDHYINGTKVIPEIIPFEKYYQRIINNNDNQYFQWLDDIDKEDNNEIFIYGHSLAPSDGDILRKFILKDNIKTTIYYYNEIDRAEKVRNLAVVLEPDNLIKLTGGTNPAIIFKTDL